MRGDYIQGVVVSQSARSVVTDRLAVRQRSAVDVSAVPGGEDGDPHTGGGGGPLRPGTHTHTHQPSGPGQANFLSSQLSQVLLLCCWSVSCAD